MKDVKLKNRKIQDKVERVTALFVHENKELRNDGSKFGKYMFLSMFVSVFVYLFFVTSSIFYAVNTQSYVYETAELNTLALEIGHNPNNEIVSKLENSNSYTNKKDKISYINRNADTAISLR